MIIHRAFVRETLHTCGAVSAILLSIFLLARLTGFLSQAVDGDIPVNSVFLLLLLKTLTYFDILAPLVLYISMLLVIGRWIRDNELTVLSACGVGMNQFLKPAMTLFLICGALTALFSLYLSPLSVEAARSVTEGLRNRAEVAGIIPGIFIETRDGNSVYFVESYDNQTGVFGGIFVSMSAQHGENEILVADSGYTRVDEKTNDDFLVLKNGARYRGTAGVAEYGTLEFETYSMRIKQRDRGSHTLPLKATPTWSLPDENHADAIGELHWRISKVAMLPVLILFALAFSSITYRKARFPGMLPALLIYFAYSNVLGLGLALIRRGVANPHVTLWVVHLVFLGLAVYLLRRRNFNLRLLPRWSA